MEVQAVIFDVDGTLVNTNAAHIEAWLRAFARFGYDVPATRIAPEVGKGGDKLVPAILGEAAEKKDGDALRDAHGEEFLQIAQAQHFAVFPGVEVLLQALHARGLRTALATSSKMEYLDATLQSAGLDLKQQVDEVVTADEAAESKPAPDIVLAAIHKLKLDPQQCVMVGDTVHDGAACRRAGVPFLGLCCGGATAASLRAAGARGTWETPADLLAHLDVALASPAERPHV